MSDLQLAQFQRAAVRHIVSRLTDDDGSKRMLLADEVGLGKTVVARGVIQQLLSRRKKLVVIYLCSNSEIAEQNRTKLDPDSEKPIGRATELAFRQRPASGQLSLYSFTSGTSLREGTGLAWERRLLLYLLYRVYRFPVHRSRWREFFRCGAGGENWKARTTRHALASTFKRKTSVEFQAALAKRWASLTLEGRKVKDVLVEAVLDYRPESAEHRQRRNRLVAALRGAMQRVALIHLKPDLVILDEVQRFREVIEQAENKAHVASALLSSDVPVLILSATPYRALTLGHEHGDGASTHYDDFFKTLEFLFKGKRELLDRIRDNLKRFGERLRRPDVAHTLDEELRKLKRDLEKDLTKVICRTERNWYVLDRRKGVDDDLIGRGMPTRAELEEFFLLHKALDPIGVSPGQVTEFWKSAPSMLTFVDSHYDVFRALERQKVAVPPALLTPATETARLATRNRRIRALVQTAIGPEGTLPRLWTAPSYFYYQDQYFRDHDSRKVLVFSGWRFVPKAVSIITSAIAEGRLRAEDDDVTSSPLKFSDKWSWHVFDVCFPSPVLASIGDRAFLAARAQGEATALTVLEQAERLLREELKSAGVAIAETGSRRNWEVLMALENRAGNGELIQQALERVRADQEEAAAESVERHALRVRDWLRQPAEDLIFSEARISMLALVAAFSPATSLLRACSSVYGTDTTLSALPDLTNVAMGPLRRYLNRPVAQLIIRKHRFRMPWRHMPAQDRGFAERTLVYAADAHLQAVLDEYVYLLRHSAQADTVEKALAKIKDVWSVPHGSPRTNRARGAGTRVRIEESADVHTTHFALAFGDDTTREAAPEDDDDQSARKRKSIVREAFNSPFWPFVLATTSVGQEGLDFHLYCRDILHWNLPSNPVDLEQREGRINRRDCLAIRASISRDWPLDRFRRVIQEPERNPWPTLFDFVERYGGQQRYKHGLFPHWVYECQRPEETVRIVRHVPCFSASRDAAKFERLKTGLALYRLVFGQINQGDLLESLAEQAEVVGPKQRDARIRRLSSYMLNLTPMQHEQAMAFAREEARELLLTSDAEGVIRLLDDVMEMSVKWANELEPVRNELERLSAFVRDRLAAGDVGSPQLQEAVAALAYLRNPYDRVFDLHVEGGFEDDIEVIREAWALLRNERAQATDDETLAGMS